MPLTSKQRKIYRRQRRVRKIRALKKKISETQDTATRRKLIEKLHRISPWEPVPD